MSGANDSIDPVLLAEFVDESVEMLSSVDSLFVELEAAPENVDLVQQIFRPVHSIKGNSAFFGCHHVKTLSHELENILDLMRKGKMRVQRKVISVLLDGVDELGEMLRRARNGEPEVVDDARFNALVENAKSHCAPPGASPVPAGISDELMGALEDIYAQCVATEAPWCDRMAAVLDGLRSAARVASESGAGQRLEVSPPEPLKTIDALLEKPHDGLLPDATAKQIGECIRKLLDAAGDDEQRAIAADLLDTYETFMAAVGFDSLVRDCVLEKTRLLAQRGKWVGTDQPSTVPEPAHPEHAQPALHGDAQKTMRVSESHIDTFLAYVGELLVLGDMFTFLQTRLAGLKHADPVAADFRRANESFANLSSNLQNSIMSIRKVPLRVLLQKAPRLVRDVVANNGKDIHVEIEGDDVEIDKSLVEVLDAPLTHMVRNAADHGIESPDEREVSGKPRQGVVRILASESSTDIILTIADDGKGIDREALREKAVSLGMIAPGAALTPDDLIALLFRSGVSTAQTVTDVSGRGVGMDVVRSNIEGAGGRIAVESRPGQGSTFAIHLPKSVTTQIINGFVVYSGGQPFVLPLESVIQTMRVPADEIESVTGRGRCVLRHGELLAVVSLQDALAGVRRPGVPAQDETLVAVRGQRGRYAVAVDSVLGVRKLVLKAIHGLSGQTGLVTGAALMGDGAIALVLGLEDLLASGPYSENSAAA